MKKTTTTHRWFKAINEKVGLIAILVALLFFLIVFVVYIVQTYRRKDFCKKLSDFFDDKDDKKSKPTKPTKPNKYIKYLKVTVFFLLAICLLAVVGYNVFRMGWDDPKITVEVEENKVSPSILVCPGFGNDNINSLISVSGKYYKNFIDIEVLNDGAAFPMKDENFAMRGRGCKLFESSKNPDEQTGGVYLFDVERTPASGSAGIFIFIGDDFKDIKDIENQVFPQGKNLHDNIGTQIVFGDSFLTYTETKYESLKDGQTERGFQSFLMGSNFTQEPSITITILAPNSVLKNVEEAPIDLAQFFSNIGGFITICSIFGFLFGSEGFVANYCFTEGKDLKKQGSSEEPEPKIIE